MASRSPQQLTKLFEQISGSDVLAGPYEKAAAEKKAAEEAAALLFAKKKAIAAERKLKKDQKDEAEQHMAALQEQVSSSIEWKQGAAAGRAGASVVTQRCFNAQFAAERAACSAPCAYGSFMADFDYAHCVGAGWPVGQVYGMLSACHTCCPGFRDWVC